MSATKNSSPPKATSPKASPRAVSAKSAPSGGSAIAHGLHVAICVLALSQATSTAKQVLTPLFGSVATNLLIQKAVMSSTVASALLPRCANAPVLGGILAIAPTAFHQVGSLMARRKDPLYGPVIAYLPVLAPAAWLTVSAVRKSLSLAPTSSFRQTSAVFSGIAVALVVTKSQSAWPSKPLFDIISLPLLSVVLGWLVVITGELSTRLSARSTDKSTTRRLSRFVTLLPIMITTFVGLNTSPTRPLTLPYTVYNSTDGTTPLLRVLSSTQSITGRIVVAENYEHGFRYLRADHSLLGGVWIGDKVHSMDTSEQAWFARDIHGEKLGDSIYSTFVLQEAARLQEREGKQDKALIIGLGAGISASAFSRHGLNTTVVEIDPAVYTAARDWFGFGLSDETKPAGGVFLEDARGWVHRRALDQIRAPTEGDKFDIVVHDCFSGGGVPEHLFTLEFWEMLKKIMTKEAIVAVNFAGHINSNPAKAILATLQKSFTTCRVFHDYYPETPEDKLPEEFINIVYFCTPSPMPLLFHHASPSDYLNSYLREYILRDFYSREVKLDLIRGNLTRDSVEETALGYVLRDDRNLLGKWEDEAALEHWALMRTIMDPIYWETY